MSVSGYVANFNTSLLSFSLCGPVNTSALAKSGQVVSKTSPYTNVLSHISICNLQQEELQVPLFATRQVYKINLEINLSPIEQFMRKKIINPDIELLFYRRELSSLDVNQSSIPKVTSRRFTMENGKVCGKIKFKLRGCKTSSKINSLMNIALKVNGVWIGYIVKDMMIVSEPLVLKQFTEKKQLNTGLRRLASQTFWYKNNILKQLSPMKPLKRERKKKRTRAEQTHSPVLKLEARTKQRKKAKKVIETKCEVEVLEQGPEGVKPSPMDWKDDIPAYGNPQNISLENFSLQDSQKTLMELDISAMLGSPDLGLGVPPLLTSPYFDRKPLKVSLESPSDLSLSEQISSLFQFDNEEAESRSPSFSRMGLVSSSDLLKSSWEGFFFS